jgi:hypothetical protein
MADFLRRSGTRQLADRAENLTLCGSYLEFRSYFTQPDHPVRLHAAKFCQQDKLCPFCAIRRGAKMLRRYSARVMHQLQMVPTLIPVMITPTVKNADDLNERFRHLTSSWSRLMNRRKEHNLGRGSWTEAAHAWGSVASIEVKRGEGSGKWHPHIHAVWLCDSMPDQDALQAEWRDLTGDSHQVHVQPFHFHRDRLAPTLENLAADFAEVFKYALKFSTMELADNLEAFTCLYSKRMIRSHGTLFGIEPPSDLTDDPLEPEDLPFITHIFRFAAGAYC